MRPGLVIDEPRSTAQAIANSQSHGDFASELLLATDASVRKWLDGGQRSPAGALLIAHWRALRASRNDRFKFVTLLRWC